MAITRWADRRHASEHARVRSPTAVAGETTTLSLVTSETVKRHRRQLVPAASRVSSITALTYGGMRFAVPYAGWRMVDETKALSAVWKSQSRIVMMPTVPDALS